MENNRTRIMTEISLAVALSIFLNFIPLFKMPQGGSVSLEMLPILIIALRRGWKAGLTTGAIYGLLQLAISPYVIHPAQLLLDYPLPYMMVGLAGLISLKKNMPISSLYGRMFAALLIGGLGRFIMHLLSGAIFFGEYAPAGQNVWIYSAVYNGSYLIPSVLISFLIIMPLMKPLVLNTERRS